jgi:hypothetical protein
MNRLMNLPKDLIYRILEYDDTIALIYKDIEWNYRIYESDIKTIIDNPGIYFPNLKTLIIKYDYESSLIKEAITRVRNVNYIIFDHIENLTNSSTNFSNFSNLTLEIRYCNNIFDFSCVDMNKLILFYSYKRHMIISNNIKGIYVSNAIINNHISGHILEECSLQYSKIGSISNLKNLKFIELDYSSVDILDLSDLDNIDNILLYKSNIDTIKLPKHIGHLYIQDCIFGNNDINDIIESIESIESIYISNQNNIIKIGPLKGIKSIVLDNTSIKIIDKSLILNKLKCINCPNLIEIPPINQVEVYHIEK